MRIVILIVLCTMVFTPCKVFSQPVKTVINNTLVLTVDSEILMAISATEDTIETSVDFLEFINTLILDHSTNGNRRLLAALSFWGKTVVVGGKMVDIFVDSYFADYNITKLKSGNYRHSAVVFFPIYDVAISSDISACEDVLLQKIFNAPFSHRMIKRLFNKLLISIVSKRLKYHDDCLVSNDLLRKCGISTLITRLTRNRYSPPPYTIQKDFDTDEIMFGLQGKLISLTKNDFETEK